MNLYTLPAVPPVIQYVRDFGAFEVRTRNNNHLYYCL